MSLETKTFEVDGHTYRLTVMPARQGRVLYYRLVQSLTPVLRDLDLTKAQDPALFLARFVMTAIAGLGPELFDDLCNACAENTFVLRKGGEDNLAKTFDSHFAGRYTAMMRWLLEAVRANGWLDFLEESIKAGLDALKAAAPQSAPESPTE